MNLTELQKEAHAIAKEQGWWIEERTFGDCIALEHGELSEVLEAYRWGGLNTWESYPDGKRYQWVPGPYDPNAKWQLVTPAKPEGIASELADVVIRVADMAERYGVRLKTIDSDDLMPPPLATFGDWITYAHHWVDCVAENHRAGYLTWKDSMSSVVCVVQRMAAHYGIDLDAAIEAKMEYSKTRLYRHGGKAL